MASWLSALQAVERFGEIEQFLGLKIVANGPPQAFVGELCEILDNQNRLVSQAEVIGFDKARVFLMPFSRANISMGFKVRACGHSLTLPLGNALLGRIVDAFAQPLDTLGAIPSKEQVPLQSTKINPLTRQAIQERLLTGIHAIDCLLPLGKGQRIGLFAGSGVGKSVLLGMISRHIASDINVIALIGERGREVNDFIDSHLDEESLKKSVVVVACSDDSALMRRQAVYTATAIAEYFCRQGKDVMLMMDSITRFAMAQREISLSLGEPPTARGYTPTVFSLLPGIVERAGNFSNQGSITALYTVLVEGDDFNEPIADNLRALLDGHIVLTRELAQRGQYPAIDILQSVSRLGLTLLNEQEQRILQQIIVLLSLYQQHRDMIAVGAYKPGMNLRLDRAVERIEAINQLLSQRMDQSLAMEILLERFTEICNE
ncbi:Flagellum-specific ATP synthase [Legionella massiliensis]|uniref:protein-secreting ATPase n=1 Tax=Legionella massiliensis TaxID=1034943 RepID=A0A078KZA0_9GAMM|nr:FliI/YscN family ATPase [Legionella massiliensis]CDZ77058.1 Flagellum-specific ATP synthase [Legionella massiliensis]CEE12796.1 Flagellum-specific ATP synthase [Legionella massiliensis]